MSYTAFGDRYGRKSGIALGATVSVIGAALQAGSVNPAMMIVARLIVGAGMGILLPAVPLYQAEIAPPSNRGLLVGLHGKLKIVSSSETIQLLMLLASLIGYGSMLSGWIGVGFFYTGGKVNNISCSSFTEPLTHICRLDGVVPLALQAIFPLVLLIVVWFLPESPRWCKLTFSAYEKSILITNQSVHA